MLSSLVTVSIDDTPVNMAIDANYLCKFSDTTSISILTSGILGEQYLGINPVIAPESAEQLVKKNTTRGSNSI